REFGHLADDDFARIPADAINDPTLAPIPSPGLTGERDGDGRHQLEHGTHFREADDIELLGVMAGQIQFAVIAPASPGTAAATKGDDELRRKNPRFHQLPAIVELAEVRPAIVESRSGALVIV